MALIKCSECDGQVSEAASACPHCGYPVGKAEGFEATSGFDYLDAVLAGDDPPLPRPPVAAKKTSSGMRIINWIGAIALGYTLYSRATELNECGNSLCEALVSRALTNDAIVVVVIWVAAAFIYRATQSSKG